MRKAAIVITVLLLVAALALMAASAGLLPLPFLGLGESGTSLSAVNMPFSTSLTEEREYAAELKPELAVDTPHGEITVQGADVDQVQIQMEIQTKAAAPLRAQELMREVSLDIQTAEDRITLQVQAPRLRNNKMARADLTLLVPHRMHVDLKTGLGDVKVREIEGYVRVLDQLGTIRLQSFKGDAYLETALGNIEISASEFDKELVALSHLGDLTVEASLAGRNMLESSLGDITLILWPEESYVLEASIDLGSFRSQVPFKGQQGKDGVKGVIGEGEQRGSIFADLSLGSLELKNQRDGRD